MPEVIDDGVTGFIVDGEEEVAQERLSVSVCLGSRVARARLSRTGRHVDNIAQTLQRTACVP
jgi:hypothetical protein